MSETKSLAAPKASFDRRSVVKGAAWSVPVIAAAIAAPAAAASHTGTPHTVTVAFYGTGAEAVQLGSETKAAQNKAFSGPTGFQIEGLTAGSSFSISAKITIQPSPAGGSDPGLGVRSVTAGSLTGGVLTANNATPANVFTATVTHSGTVPSTGIVPIPMNYYYRGIKGDSARNFSVSLSNVIVSNVLISSPVPTLITLNK